MIDINEAIAKVVANAQPIGVELRHTIDSIGYVAAEDVIADVHSPPHDKALVDGFAVRSEDIAAEGRTTLNVIERVIAGDVPQKTIAPGTATQVMTGAPIPKGADAMVMIEDTECEHNQVYLAKKTAAGQSIMRRSTTFARGDCVLRQGTTLRPIEVGLLSEVGCVAVQCYRKPSIAVLPTGEELVSPTTLPAAGQVRNSNGPMLTARAKLASDNVRMLEVAQDNAKDLRSKIEDGLQADILLLSGGVSAGIRDLVPPTLEAAGVECVFHKVQLKPGKPVWFGISKNLSKPTLVFGLPGNPVSSLVCFELFVETAIRAVSGLPIERERVPIRLGKSFQTHGTRPTFWPARTVQENGRLFAIPLNWRGSADMLTVTQADRLIQFEPRDSAYQYGEKLESLPLR